MKAWMTTGCDDDLNAVDCRLNEASVGHGVLFSHPTWRAIGASYAPLTNSNAARNSSVPAFSRSSYIAISVEEITAPA